MAKTQTGTTTIALAATLQEVADLGTNKAPLAVAKNIAWANGESANQCEMVWGDTRTLAASTTEDLDLAGGLTDGLGGTITFTAIKEIYVSAASDNGDTISIGGAASNTFVGPFADASDKVKIPANGSCHIVAPTAAGWTVTASTADLLRIGNDDSGDTADYSIFVRGIV